MGVLLRLSISIPAFMQVMEISLANEMRCEAFKGQFQKFDYLWTKDLQVGHREEGGKREC